MITVTKVTVYRVMVNSTLAEFVLVKTIAKFPGFRKHTSQVHDALFPLNDHVCDCDVTKLGS